MSTLVIEARMRFSLTDRIGSASSSGSPTTTSITGKPALIAAWTRRLPAMIVSLPSYSATRGGWMIPTGDMIEARSWSSIAFGTLVRRGSSGFRTRILGSTLRSSAIIRAPRCCAVSAGFCETGAGGRIPGSRVKGASKTRARLRAEPLRRATGMWQRCFAVRTGLLDLVRPPSCGWLRPGWAGSSRGRLVWLGGVRRISRGDGPAALVRSVLSPRRAVL